MLVSCYGAGPDVFFPNARALFRRKVEICAQHGIRLRVPFENEIEPGIAGAATLIYRANRAMMLDCDICIANISPFRGPSADDGTAFELGFFDALQRPVFAYSHAALPLIARTRAFQQRNPDPFAIEPFGLPANLMLPGAALERGGLPVFTPAEDAAPEDLAVFTRLVAAVAARCAPIGHLRQALAPRFPEPTALDAALRQPRAALGGRSALEAAIAVPGDVPALAAKIVS